MNEGSFETTTSVSIHPGCQFTTYLPRPEFSEDCHSLKWKGTVERNKSSSEEASALIKVNGRHHGYLFWEFGNAVEASKVQENFVSSVVGYQSIVDHKTDAFVLEGIEEYDDWCHTMLTTLGLGVREQDDFVAFWARSIFENGPFVIARVVPESDLRKCTSLSVTANCGDKSVHVDIHRIYVTMIVCKTIPCELCCGLHIWKTESHSPIRMPEELAVSFPIKHVPEALKVVEWGGVVLTM